MAKSKKPQVSDFVKMREERKSVTIRKVANGFVVTGCRGDYENEKTWIAKTEEEAKALASKIL